MKARLHLDWVIDLDGLNYVIFMANLLRTGLNFSRNTTLYGTSAIIATFGTLPFPLDYVIRSNV